MRKLLCRLGLHKLNKTMHVEAVGHIGAVAVIEGMCQRCGRITTERYKVDTGG